MSFTTQHSSNLAQPAQGTSSARWLYLPSVGFEAIAAYKLGTAWRTASMGHKTWPAPPTVSTTRREEMFLTRLYYKTEDKCPV